ncbi:MAG: hypothetical protein JOY61_00645, partial [Chloroflexi bacterium]|nr:hypothetical protein [Chloroflexota bacterium]
MARGYSGRRGSRLDLAELISVLLLGVIGLWGAWFGVQSLITLWFPVNVAYLLAGLVVAGVSVLVGR